MVEEVKIPKRTNGILHGLLYRSSQSNPTKKIVIMAHGFTGDKLEWGRFPATAEKLIIAGYDVILFDFSGSGENVREPILRSQEVKDLEDVYSWALSKGYSEFGTIGLSFGGLISLLANLPNRKVAVFWAPAFYIGQNLKHAWGSAYNHRKFLLKFKKILKMKCNNGNKQPLQLNYQYFRENDSLQVNPILNSFTTPSLILQGVVDTVVTLEKTRKAFSELPHDDRHQLIEIEKASHGFEGQALDMAIENTVNWIQKYLK